MTISSVIGRRLSFRLVPEYEESFDSYIARMAFTTKVSVEQILKITGLLPPDSVKRSPYWLGITLTGLELEAFLYVTRLSESDVGPMLLASAGGRIINSNIFSETFTRYSRHAMFMKTWISLSYSKVCPKCILDNNGAWKLKWNYPWSLYCIEHKMPLITRCPRCRKLIGATRRLPGHNLSALGPIDHLTCCDNTLAETYVRGQRPVSLCCLPFAEMFPSQLSPDSHQLALQREIDKALDGEQMTVGGIEVSSVEYFEDLFSLCKLSLFGIDLVQLLSEAEKTGSAYGRTELENLDLTRESRLKGASRRSLHFLTVVLPFILPRVVETLSMQTLEDFCEKVRPILMGNLARHNQETSSLWRTINVEDTSDRLKYCLLKAIKTHVDQSFNSSEAMGTRLEQIFYKIPESRRINISAEQIPQFLWDDEFDKYFLEIFSPTTYLRRLYQRLFCSISLLRFVSGITWVQAAGELQIEEADVRKAYRESYFLRKDNKHELFEEQLRCLASNYSKTVVKISNLGKANLFASFDKIPVDHLRNLYTLADINFAGSDSANVISAAWIWSFLTGQALENAPAYEKDIFKLYFRRWYWKTLPKLRPLLIRYSEIVVLQYTLDLTQEENQVALRENIKSFMIECMQCGSYNVARRRRSNQTRTSFKCGSCQYTFIEGARSFKKSEELKLYILERLSEGVSKAELAKHHDISEQTILRWVREKEFEYERARNLSMYEKNSVEFKKTVAETHIREGSTLNSTAAKFGISSHTVSRYLKMHDSEDYSFKGKRKRKPLLGRDGLLKLREQIEKHPNLNARERAELMYTENGIAMSQNTMSKYVQRIEEQK